MSLTRERRYPLGAALTLEKLSGDPHAALARLRAGEPVSWVPCLDGWLVTRHDLASGVMGDSATFTVDDPRFSTAQVIGPSMLSLDGQEHTRHRAPFIATIPAPGDHAGAQRGRDPVPRPAARCARATGQDGAAPRVRRSALGRRDGTRTGAGR